MRLQCQPKGGGHMQFQARGQNAFVREHMLQMLAHMLVKVLMS
jgi:hypothetical protein